MAARSTPAAEASDLGFCDNHPEVPAVHVTDGLKFDVIRLCKSCMTRWESALNGGRRRG